MDISDVKAIAERALADGILSPNEMAEIEEAVMADGVVTDEEVKLLEEIRTKVLRGEIKLGDGRTSS